MTDTPLHYKTIAEVAALIEARQLSPVELTNATLERIDALDGHLKSYATVMSDHALAAAQIGPSARYCRRTVSRTAAWRPHRRQGPLLHRRRSHHGRREGVYGSRAGLRFDRGSAA